VELSYPSKVCVVGLGYIGLPTAALLASRGIQVHGVDVQENVVNTINEGNIHIIEPELDILVRASVDTKRLRASLTAEAADVYIIAVPTPFKQIDEKDYPVPCIDYVLQATESIAEYIQDGNLIIIESTSPVGTTEKVAQKLEEKNVDLSKIFLAYCPERVLPGHVIKELIENDRIIGGINQDSTDKAENFYKSFVTGKIHKTSCRLAEMAKLTENAYRDVNIAFANELSMICDTLNLEVNELINLANCHPRVNVLKPGCGVGGHCIAVDPWFIVDSDPANSRTIRTAREVNDYKSLWVIEKIKSAYRGIGIERPAVALCGLSFKPDIDDLRTSPALKIVQALTNETDVDFLIVEPNIESHPKFKLVDYEHAIKNANLVVRLVAHSSFSQSTVQPDPGKQMVLDFACS
jgi:UDP-N-acetyl-D-mannosaminuronic acid dehydrogenase